MFNFFQHLVHYFPTYFAVIDMFLWCTSVITPAVGISGKRISVDFSTGLRLFIQVRQDITLIDLTVFRATVYFFFHVINSKVIFTLRSH